MSALDDLRDFFDMLRGRDTSSKDDIIHDGADNAKGLTIEYVDTSSGSTIDLGGFVNEVRPDRRFKGIRTDTQSLQSTRLKNEIVMACIKAKADTSQDPRLIVQRRIGNTDEYEEMRDHPFRALMMRPNSNSTEADLTRAALVSWDISNPRRFYCEKVFVNGLLKELHPLDPSFMSTRRSRSGSVVGYVWDDGSMRREYSQDELLIRSAPSWYDPPPMIAALGSVGIDTSQTDYVQTFFNNGGTPPGYLKVNLPLSPGQKDDIRAQWRDRYGNALGKQFDVGVLDRDADYKEIGSKIDQLASELLRSVPESRICMVFGVPPIIIYSYFGLSRSTYSNMKQAWSSFWDATMSPLFKEWRAFWLWHLLTEFEDENDILSEKIRLHYDMSQVAALQDDVDALHERSRKNFVAGGITLNEFRSDIGKKPDDGGNYYLSNMTRIAIPAGSDPSSAKSHTNDGSMIEFKTGRNKPSMRLIEKRIEQTMQQYIENEFKIAARLVAGE